VLTRRGWSLAGAAAGLAVAARLLGLAELAVLAAVAFALLGGLLVTTRLRRAELVARRTVPEHLRVGVDGRIDLEVEALERATPAAVVVERVDAGRHAARFLLPALAPGQTARAAYRVPTERRGRYELGPLRCGVLDPFGLVRGEWRIAGVDEVVVYPRVHEILPPPESAGDELDPESSTVPRRSAVGAEFHTLREYAVGDDLRRVHWRSTARRGELMIRQDESRRRAPYRVLLDVRPTAHDRASFERAVEAAASVLVALERAGRPGELLASSGIRLGTSGRRHLESVLDELAIVEPHADARIAPPAGRRHRGGLVAVVGALRADDGAALARLAGPGAPLVVVATRAGVASPGRPSRFVAAGPDRPFPDAWNEAILRWQRGTLRSRSSSPSPH